MMMATTNTNSVNGHEENNTDDNNNDRNINNDNDRKIRIQKEMEICNTLKVKELKLELESIYGVSTSSYIEKSEFVRALAELRVDGVIPVAAPTTKKTATSSSSSSSTSSSSRGQSTKDDNETHDNTKDPTYRDVTVTKLSSGNKSILLDGKVIDTRARK
jgi:hypothetical protein